MKPPAHIQFDIKEIANVAQDDIDRRRRPDAGHRCARANGRVRLVGRTSTLARLASWILPSGDSGLCRPGLWRRLLCAPPGQDALWARAALGQCLLLG